MIRTLEVLNYKFDVMCFSSGELIKKFRTLHNSPYLKRFDRYWWAKTQRTFEKMFQRAMLRWWADVFRTNAMRFLRRKSSRITTSANPNARFAISRRRMAVPLSAMDNVSGSGYVRSAHEMRYRTSRESRTSDSRNSTTSAVNGVIDDKEELWPVK